MVSLEQICKLLLDSGATVSIICFDVLPDAVRETIVPNYNHRVIDANGHPLDVRGTITLAIQLRSFTMKQEFVVANNITVDCLLGAHFLSKHGAIINCTTQFSREPQTSIDCPDTFYS